MPFADEHLEKARHAEALAFRLNADSDRERDWIVTLMFYAAVHSVEAFFAGGTPPVHNPNHGKRFREIGASERLRAIGVVYRDLENFSRIARYRYHRFSDQELNEALQALRAVQAACRIPEVSGPWFHPRGSAEFGLSRKARTFHDFRIGRRPGVL